MEAAAAAVVRETAAATVVELAAVAGLAVAAALSLAAAAAETLLFLAVAAARLAGSAVAHCSTSGLVVVVAGTVLPNFPPGVAAVGVSLDYSGLSFSSRVLFEHTSYSASFLPPGLPLFSRIQSPLGCVSSLGFPLRR